MKNMRHRLYQLYKDFLKEDKYFNDSIESGLFHFFRTREYARRALAYLRLKDKKARYYAPGKKYRLVPVSIAKKDFILVGHCNNFQKVKWGIPDDQVDSICATGFYFKDE